MCQRGTKKHGEEVFYDGDSPDFSEAPDLRSPAPHPKTNFRKINCTNRNTPMPQVSIQLRHFSKQACHFDEFGLRSPVVQKTFYWKCATSIVERVELRTSPKNGRQ